ncbi:hypothetical protein V6N12_062334 [Hibiscus sabdariffa]|uniref:Uncharacterized protein n=1 Tax=Hibiscus sabdariffa TaxID=183260 RepID=A0ABR2F8N9_9ROSI
MLFDEFFVGKENLTAHCSRLTEEYTTCIGNNAPRITASNVIDLGWKGLESGWINANADGAVNPRDGSVATGGVLCDKHEDWNFQFSQSIKSCLVLLANLWAIHNILHHIWNLKSSITFIDDYSLYMYLYMLHHKSEALDGFKVFKAELEKQCSKQIKIVRTDRAGEYYGR